MAVDHAGAHARWLRAAGIGLLCLAVALDLALHAFNDELLWPALVVIFTGLAALTWPARLRPRWLTPTVRTAVPALASIACTAISFLGRRHVESGPAEVAILLALLLVGVRSRSATSATVCGLAAGAAVAALPLRHVPDYGPIPLMMVLAAGFAVLGAHLRSLDTRRLAAVVEARRAERLAIAADLHDYIAHHVTGIHVQTQMARMLLTSDPGKIDPILERVEQAATDALAAMRRTVGILRTGPGPTGAPADRFPSGALTALPELVAGLRLPNDTRAVLHRDPSMPQIVPHEIQAAVYRVVQESLTNVRRHAADATAVDVELRHLEHSLRVTTRYNGRGGARLPPAARGGGFGLIGLTERVTALGGDLTAGRHPDGGWQVTARLPWPSGDH
jgi:signal transduction histidine kinase